MDLVGRIVDRNFPQSGALLRVGGISVDEIAGCYDTPLFVYDRDVLDKKWTLLRETLPSRFAIYYSVKANPNPSILRHFVGRGAGLEVASAGELSRARSAGCAARRILFAGPGKTEAELEFALAHDIGEIHVESELEARRIGNAARKLAVCARVAVRVNPAAEAQGGAMRMGGKPAPFGVDEENLKEVLDLLLSEPAVEFRGLHLFTGTQILDYTILTRQYRSGLTIARRIAASVGHPLHTVDFGGGFGVPYFPNEHELDTERLREALRGLMVEVEGDRSFDGTEFIVEPGRYLTAEAGIYITRINDIKTSRGKTFYIVDGGMNHHLAASGNLGQVIKRNFPLAVLNRLGQRPTQTVDVVGPLCTPLDTLARDAQLPPAEVGDLIGIFQSGAYGLTASPVNFLSHPTPAEVLAGGGVAEVVGPRTPLGGFSQ